MAEAWLINPGKEMRPRIRVSKRKRIGKLRKRSPLKDFKINRRRKGVYTMAKKRRRRRRARPNPNPFRPRRRRRRRARSNPNPFRRRRRSYRRRSRSYRRNPPAFRSLGPDLGWAAVGFIATKFTGNMITPMIAGIAGGGDIMRIGIKFGVAYIAAWGLEMAFGRRVFTQAFVGGSLDAIQDAIKTFIAPTFPQLAEPLSIYYEPTMVPRRPAIGEYYQPGNGADAYDYAT